MSKEKAYTQTRSERARDERARKEEMAEIEILCSEEAPCDERILRNVEAYLSGATCNQIDDLVLRMRVSRPVVVEALIELGLRHSYLLQR